MRNRTTAQDKFKIVLNINYLGLSVEVSNIRGEFFFARLLQVPNGNDTILIVNSKQVVCLRVELKGSQVGRFVVVSKNRMQENGVFL